MFYQIKSVSEQCKTMETRSFLIGVQEPNFPVQFSMAIMFTAQIYERNRLFCLTIVAMGNQFLLKIIVTLRIV